MMVWLVPMPVHLEAWAGVVNEGCRDSTLFPLDAELFHILEDQAAQTPWVDEGTYGGVSFRVV